MNRYTLIALAALIAGCATPQEVRDTGEKFVHQLKRPPALAAACVARNIEESYYAFSVVIRPLDTPEQWEMVWRVSEILVRAVAQLEPDGTGSRATIWRNGSADVIPTMIAGC